MPPRGSGTAAQRLADSAVAASAGLPSALAELAVEGSDGSAGRQGGGQGPPRAHAGRAPFAIAEELGVGGLGRVVRATDRAWAAWSR